MSFKLRDWRDFRRGIIALAGPAVITWLGGNAISNISERYDGLCPVQGRGMGTLLYDGNPQGYCTGIGDDLAILGFIMAVAVLALIGVAILWWEYSKRIK